MTLGFDCRVLRAAIARVLVVAGSVTLSASARQAQESSRPAAARLTLSEVYAVVDRASPRAAATRARARAAAARVAGARRPPDPVLQFGWMNYSLPGLRADPALGMRQLQLMQMVPFPGKLAAAGDAMRARSAAALAQADEARWSARVEAAVAFYERWEAQQQLAIVRETRRLLEDATSVASAMYRVGTGPQADLLRAQVAVAQMDEEIVRMSVMDTGAQAMLLAAMNLSADTALAMPEIPSFPDSLPPRDVLDRMALGSRPMLAAGDADVEAATADRTGAARERWPDLQVGIQYGERAMAMGTDRMASLMIGVSLPVWAGSRQLKMREEAEAMQAMAESDRAAMRAETRGRVAALHAELAGTRRLITLYRTSIVPRSEAAAESALGAYRAGQVDFDAVTDSRMAVNRYRQALVALEATQGRAWAEFEMLLGRPLLVLAATDNPDGGR